MREFIIKNIGDLEQHEPIWTDILKDNNNDNPFIEFDWIRYWWTYFGKSYELHVLVISTEDKITGFCPLMIKKHRMYQELTFIGYPQASFMDFIVRNEYALETLEFIADYFLNLKGSFIVKLHGMFEDSINFKLIKNSIEKRQLNYFINSLRVYFIKPEERNFEEYFNSKFTSHGRKELRRRKKKLEELGDLKYCRLSEESMEEIFKIHNKRWRKKNDGSNFSKENIKNFFTELAIDKTLSFKVVINSLCFGNRVIAFKYGFECNGRYSSYRIAHDDDFNIYGPGNLINMERIKECFENGIKIYDFGTGADQYKSEWADGSVNVNKLIFHSKNVISQLIYLGIVTAMKAKILLKKNRRLVRFKRTTLGKIKYFISRDYFLSTCKKAVNFISRFKRF